MTNYDISRFLLEIAVLLELSGENSFKVSAYQNAALHIERLTENLTVSILKNEFPKIQGIGESIQKKIEEFVKDGRSKYLEDLKSKIPAGFFDLLKIPDIGAKRIIALNKELGIETVGELEYACKENRLLLLPGFGIKLQNKILENIRFVKKNSQRHLYHDAKAAGENIIEHLKKAKDITNISIAGSLRRFKETIKDIDIVASSSKAQNILEYFVSGNYVEKTTEKGSTKASIITKAGIACDLRVVSDEEYPFLLHHLTGSKEHNTAMRSHAKKKKIKMNEYGLFKKGTEKTIKCKSEENIFEKLGLSFIPPELRENTGEIEAAAENRIPKLIEGKDIKGLLHIHSNYSDGSNTIEELAENARDKGYEYIAICDHSQSAQYANGLKPDNIKKQHNEIDKLNQKISGIRILKGTETDIKKDGTLDYPDEILKEMDVVIASVHSSFSMDETSMTDRILKAIKNPYVNILGHPTGRLLLSREGYQVNLHEIIKSASSLGVAVELNANPHRLDIDWRFIPQIKKENGLLAICPDAHAWEDVSYISIGIGMARKGWTIKDDVVNCLDLESFLKLCKKRRA